MEELYTLSMTNHDFLRLIAWFIVVIGLLQLGCLVLLLLSWRRAGDNEDTLIGAMKAVKGYLEAAEREHVATASELKPAVAETKEIVAQAKSALEVTPRNGQPVTLGKYVQDNTHDVANGLQKIASKLDLLLLQRGVKT